MSIYIVAEIGINHNGDVNIAKQLIDVALVAGFDAVKFQTKDIESAFPKELLDKKYENERHQSFEFEK